MNKYICMGALAILAQSGLAFADAGNSLADDLVGSLYTMRSVYRAEYAPAAWKKQFAGYDLETEFSKAVAATQANPNLTIKDSREILKNFIYAMKDYHTSISFVSTEVATLPLMIKGTSDHFFIVYIDRTKLSEASFPFHVGDEVVSFGGIPTLDAVKSVQAEIPANVDATDRALAELSLTRRRAARGLSVPQGPITLGIQASGAANISNIQLIWDYTPERIFPRTNLFDKENLLADSSALSLGSASNAFHPKMNAKITGSPLAIDTPFDVGVRKTFTPDLGAKIWESAPDSTFYAYIYKTADRRLIGYVRFAQYEAPDYVKALADFAAIIDRFQNTTDAMIIDQVNNPGGSVFYLYGLASMLSDQPLKTPLHRMAINQADVNAALTSIEQMKAVKTDDDAKKAFAPADLDGYPASYEFAQFTLKYAQFIVSEWNAGHKLTAPYWIAGVDHINPSATHYSKPILLLTNHLDFSGGDFFPTIMQDNNRVTILGSRTAGAGGYVADVNVPNNIGVDAFRCTESIAERVSGNPIENLGVTPNIAYEMTAEDFTGNFAPYTKAIQAAVDSLTH